MVDATSSLAAHAGAGVNLFAFLDRADGAEQDGSVAMKGSVAQMEVAGIVFGYGREPVLQGVDVELKAGEVVAIVGASGAGKSTLVQLLTRLRSPERGGIMVDGVGLDQVSRASLARNVGVVFDDGIVFDESIELNVTLGRALPSADVARALRITGVDSVAKALPRGLASPAGPRGRNLSAGQRQRVTLARAIAGRPAILILDEATSALDSEAERQIADRLRAWRPEAITLLIAHRLSTVRTADRILVLDHGRIVANGTHDDLLETCAVYRVLVETQLVEGPAVV
jgi:ATP-binding cassette subfamily B protein/subfamily B ATP-binding cassette protein MsbA